MRRRGPRGLPRVGTADLGGTAIDDDALEAAGEFKGETSRMRLRREGLRRHRPDVDDHHARSGFHPLVAGIRRVAQGLSPRVVIGQDGGDQFRRGQAHAVEQRHRAVAMAKQAQHRHHAIDGVEDRLRHLDAARGIGLP